MKNTNKALAVMALLTCWAALAACDPGRSGNCYYDVGASVYPEGVRESARIFYPCGIDSVESVVATTLTNGRGGSKEKVYWLAEPIAKNGIVVCDVGALDNQTEEGYQIAQRTGLGILAYENENPTSPLVGKIRAYGVMGYSLGGGAAINIASDRGPQVKTCVALSPYGSVPTPNLSAATLILTCEEDSVAPPTMGFDAFEAIQSSIPKTFATMAAQNHFFWLNNSNPGSADDYIIAWLKYWLEGDPTYSATLEHPASDMIDVRLEAAPLLLGDPSPGDPSSDSSGGCN